MRLGEVRVDGQIRRPDYRPMPGEDIAIVTRISSGKTLDIKDLPPSLPPLIVKHEDPHFAVVVKPEGLNTVGDGAGGWTAERMLPYFLRPTAGVEGALVRPRPVHRLDARTGGLLVVAKTRLAMTSLSEAFASRKVSKRYRAVLCGTPKFDGQTTIEVDDAAEIGTRLTLGVDIGTRLTLGVIDAPMEKKECVSHWRVVSHVPCERYGRLTLVDMWPKTGRTHQLRKHAAGALGCPILGDGRYTARHCAGRYRGFVSVVDGGGAAAERDAVAVRGRGDGGGRRRPQVASREGRHRPGEVQGPRRDVSVPLGGGGWTRFLLSFLAFRRMHNLSFTREVATV